MMHLNYGAIIRFNPFSTALSLRASNEQRSVRQKYLLLNYIFEDLQIFRIWIYHAWAIFSPSLLSALLPSANISFLFIRWISSVNLPHSSLNTATIHFVPMDILKVLQFCLAAVFLKPWTKSWATTFTLRLISRRWVTMSSIVFTWRISLIDIVSSFFIFSRFMLFITNMTTLGLKTCSLN